MRITIINQPTGNRGDESAHKALVRSLVQKYPNDKIVVAFFGESVEQVQTMQVREKNVEYIYIPCEKGKTSISVASYKYKVASLVCKLHPSFRKMDNVIKKSDYVICAPGGICMGKFMNWSHIFWLSRALHHNKKTAYYSRSFGPFNKGNRYYQLFEDESMKILKSCQFISIRDNVTFQFANNLKLDTILTTDTAFLENPNIDIPAEVQALIGEDYVVFVPNQLTWQFSFKNVSQESIDKIHLHVIDELIQHFPNSKIVMLPQLYGQGSLNDYIYFNSLKGKISSVPERIVIVKDIYSSDLQQTIISKSKFVVGGRYHSIVFSINNNIPFLALSYEHKMFGLLDVVNLKNKQVDMRQLTNDELCVEAICEQVSNLIRDGEYELTENRSVAKNMALNCFEKLTSKYINLCK